MSILTTAIRILDSFPFQLVIAANLFACGFPRRHHFWLRLIAFFAPMVIVYDMCVQTFGIHIVENMVLDRSLMLIPVMYTCVGIFFCYRCTMPGAIYCTASAHPAQNMVYNLYWIVKMYAGFEEGTAQALPFSFAIMLVIYSAVYFGFARRLKSWEESELIRKRLAFNSVVVMLLVVFLNQRVPDGQGTTAVTVYLAYVIGDVLALSMQFGLFFESVLERKYAIVEQLLYAEQKKQRQIGENTEIINRKCHDLKHQLEGLKRMENGPERNACLQEIENAVMIYKNAVKTGNETLDLILMDKLLFCDEHHIHLSCVADAKLIDWMDTMDLYALFGNALDNAIESVIQEPEESNRIISFRISQHGQFVSIHFENYVGHEVKLSGGLPVTSKEDKQYHGFGVLSIRHIVEKYKGTMSIRVDDNLFRLNILFPIQ